MRVQMQFDYEATNQAITEFLEKRNLKVHSVEVPTDITVNIEIDLVDGIKENSDDGQD